METKKKVSEQEDEFEFVGGADEDFEYALPKGVQDDPISSDIK